MENLQQIIQERLTISYGSMYNPNYSFVAKSFEKQPYKKVISEISTRLLVEDITDINYDVSFSYILKNEELAEYSLQLSMVGRFFTLSKLGTARQVVQVLSQGFSDDEMFILLILDDNGFLLIDESTLQLESQLRDNGSGERLCVYQALFTNS